MRWPASAFSASILQFALVLFGMHLLAACSSTSTTTRSPHAIAELDRGVCPPQIIQVNGDNYSSQRYGSNISREQLLNYQRHELENCNRKLMTGDSRALSALVNFWNSGNRPDKVADAYALFVANSRNRDRLSEASATLYQMYSEGRGTLLPADDDLAFKYLGLAVRYGVTNYSLAYADALHARGLYKDAFSYYSEIANDAGANGGGKRYSQDQVCEVNFKMGDLYFRGRGVEENWYLGYYYWRRAQAQAANPEWGSCIRDNFAFPERHQLESERLPPVKERIARLSNREREEIEEALDKSYYRGLSLVTAMPFTGQHIPVSKAVARTTQGSAGSTVAQQPGSRPSPPPPSGNVTGALTSRTWQPLSASVCTLQDSQTTLPWSDVFELRSPAIWTLNSNDAQRRTLGSAVAVSRDSLITNCHMINGVDGISLRQGNRSLSAFLSAADPEGDRCILRVAKPLPGYVVSSKRSSSVRVGEDVAAIGNPKGLDTSLSRGIVAQKRQKGGRAYIQTDAALSSGSSGGGLFDAAGNLVGITTFTVDAGANLNFAIAVEEFCRD